MATDSSQRAGVRVDPPFISSDAAALLGRVLLAQAMAQPQNFFKNVAILGGMLMAAVCGPGRFSVDRG